MNKYKIYSLIIISLASSAKSATVSYGIIGYVNPSATAGSGGAIFNTSTDVPTAGDSTNWISSSAGNYVDFAMGDTNNGNTLSAHLRVTVGSMNIGSVVDQGNLMIAATSNSQGLTDTETISILFDGTAPTTGDYGITLTFDWYTPDGLFTTKLDHQYLYTSYDIDFNQTNIWNNSDIDSYYLANTAISGVDTLLTDTVTATTTSFSDLGNTNATVSDVRNAYSVRTTNGNQQQIELGKTTGSGNALFMLQFGDPSGNLSSTLIPEPSTFMLLALSSFGIFIRRRRS